MGSINMCTGACLSRGCNCQPRASTKRTICRIILDRVNRAPCPELSPGDLRSAVLDEYHRPQVSISSINNAISHLVKKNEIRRVSRGKYSSIFILTQLKARTVTPGMTILTFPNLYNQITT